MRPSKTPFSSPSPLSSKQETCEKLEHIERSVVRKARHVAQQGKDDRTVRMAHLDDDYRKRERDLIAVCEQMKRERDASILLSREKESALDTPTSSFLETMSARKEDFRRETEERNRRREIFRQAQQHEIEKLEMSLSSGMKPTDPPQAAADVPSLSEEAYSRAHRRSSFWFSAESDG